MRNDEGPTRVWVRHSEPVFAAGLSHGLSRATTFEIVPGGSSADELSTPPAVDVVLCDLEGSRGISRSCGDAAIVLLMRNPRPIEIQLALGRGVMGLLATHCSLDEMCSAVRAAARGERFLCRIAARQMADGLTDETLTGREQEVLSLLAQGRCNKGIATRLDIAVGTVKTHVRSIMAKLDATSRTHAASVAIARGMLPDPRGDLPVRAPSMLVASAAAGRQRVGIRSQ